MKSQLQDTSNEKLFGGALPKTNPSLRLILFNPYGVDKAIQCNKTLCGFRFMFTSFGSEITKLEFSNKVQVDLDILFTICFPLFKICGNLDTLSTELMRNILKRRKLLLISFFPVFSQVFSENFWLFIC